MTLLTAGYVDGSRVKAEMLRRDLWASTQGATGVVRSTDLKVYPTTPASTSIIVGAGSAVIESSFANAAGNSYIVSNDSELMVPVPSSAGTYWALLAVRDPQYAGQSTPSDPLTNSYTDVQVRGSLPSNQPYVKLAKVTVGSTGASVTAANISDERQMARQRRSRELRIYAPTSTNSLGTAYQQWPTDLSIGFDCPKWATNASVVVTLAGVECMVSGYARAELKPTINGASSPDPVMHTVRNQANQRMPAITAGRFDIDPAWRGQTVMLGLRAAVRAGAAGAFQLDTDSTMTFDVDFYERAL